jgi:tetratricopeptide (TPR) repeat protein
MKLTRVVTAMLALALCAAAPGARAQSTDAELTFNTGLTHLREGRLDMALDSFRKAISQDSKNPYFYKGLGIALTQAANRCGEDQKCRMSRLEEAIAASRKALEINPYYTDARNDLGTTLVLAGRHEEGKKELLAAYEDAMNPTPEMSARNLGQAYFEEKNYGEAYNWFRTATQRNPKYVDAYLGLADTLTALGRLDEAIATLELGDKQVADSPALLLSLGEACFQAGRFTEARGYLERVARVDPAGPRGRRALEKLRQFPH